MFSWVDDKNDIEMSQHSIYWSEIIFSVDAVKFVFFLALWLQSSPVRNIKKTIVEALPKHFKCPGLAIGETLSGVNSKPFWVCPKSSRISLVSFSHQPDFLFAFAEILPVLCFTSVLKGKLKPGRFSKGFPQVFKRFSAGFLSRVGACQSGDRCRLERFSDCFWRGSKRTLANSG